MRSARLPADASKKPSNNHLKKRDMQPIRKARPIRVLVVPRIAISSSAIVTIACPICEDQHTYLRSDALPPQICPQQPDSGIALFVVPPSDAIPLATVVAA